MTQRCGEEISFICTWARRQYTSVEVGTTRRIGKALTNNPPYLVGGRDRWFSRIYPRPRAYLQEKKRTALEELNVRGG